MTKPVPKLIKFKMHRDKVVASTMGLSIAFKKGELQGVPPYMIKDVLAAGGVSEEDLSEEELLPPSAEPTDPEAREKAIFAVFEDMVLRNVREEFTAGGAPHASVVTEKLGWAINAKDRDLLFAKFKAGQTD